MLKNNQSGMTLIEVIAVIVLITLIAATVGNKVFTSASKAKANLNVTKMNSLKNYLQNYKLEYNNYPSKLDDLVKGGGAAKQNNQPFTPFASEEDLKDVWGSPYTYSTENNGRSFVLKSMGEDGAPGGEGVNQDVEVKP
ncbi:MAG: type II secretion system protein GspG [Proteobacteria bacterium]|nr:type II secretion system protein GspG [Pseudomonadota bacterium]